ncbi:hypothetical protein PG994_009374 [Apiospora phragmitis]|uniref:Rhodopsin domain-containing protein n=1 Tax=Apiospora phragmitis TaxID=2905665 RepID=A0ABR1ULF3_9PEZI
MSSVPPGFNAARDGDVALVGNFVVWAMTLVSGAFLGFRIYIRKTRMQPWWDDYVLVGGWFFTIAQSVVFSEMLRRGFAKATIDEPTILMLMLIGDNLQKFALSLTKLSFSLTLLRIFTSGWQRWTIIALLFVINSYYIAHLFLVWMDICDHLSAASDFILAFLPLSRMLEVTMKSHDKMVAAIITTSVGVMTNGRAKPDFHSIWVYHIVGIAEPNATIVAASIPILRAFFRTQKSRDAPTFLLRGMGPYVASNSAGKFSNAGGGKARTSQSSDAFSEHTAPKGHEEDGHEEEDDGLGIMRTRTVAITYDHNTKGGPQPEAGDIEMLSRSAPS